jgi:hypothetical protein
MVRNLWEKNKMIRTLKSLCFLAAASALIVMTSQARAEDSPANELDFGLGAVTVLGVGAGNSAALTFGSGVDTAFAMDLSYSRSLADFVAATFEGDFYTQSSATIMFLKVGPTFNISIDSTGIRNAVYFRALGGMALTHFVSSTVYFAYKLELGKRFELVHGLAWKPAFNMTGYTATGNNPLFAFVPLQFSFVF